MSINVMLSNTKIHNVSYRIFSYLENPNRQEKILFSGGNITQAEWKQIAKFEKDNQKSNEKNNEAREIMLALPNSLIDNPTKTEEIINEFIEKNIGKDHPYHYTIHQKAKSKTQDNLHCHIVFSERTKNENLEIKKYKKDIWYDKEKNRMCKAGMGELIHKKGDIVYDQEGNPQYNSDPFSIKDKKFKEKAYTQEMKKSFCDILNQHGFDFSIYNNNDIYLKQKKVYKGYSEEKKKETIEFNNEVKRYNNLAKQVVKQQPNLKETLLINKKQLFNDKNLPLQDKIKSLSDRLYNSIHSVKEKVEEQTRKVAYWWKAHKQVCSKATNGNLKIKKMRDNFCYVVEIKNGDYEVKRHEDNDYYKIGIKENSKIEIYDAREEMSWQKTKTNEKGLLQFFGISLKSPERAKKPLNLNEYKQKAQEYYSDHIHVPSKSKGFERD